MNFMWFLDFEASSLSPLSYPIEAGIAKLNLDTGEVVESHGWLIKPTDYWFDWNDVSQKVHGLTLNDLKDGHSPLEVAQALNDILGHQLVYCDGLFHDMGWTLTLFRAAGIDETFKLCSIQSTLHLRAVSTDLPDASVIQYLELVKELFKLPRPHRAEADARELAGRVNQCWDLPAFLQSGESLISRDKP